MSSRARRSPRGRVTVTRIDDALGQPLGDLGAQEPSRVEVMSNVPPARRHEVWGPSLDGMLDALSEPLWPASPPITDRLEAVQSRLCKILATCRANTSPSASPGSSSSGCGGRTISHSPNLCTGSAQ